MLCIIYYLLYYIFHILYIIIIDSIRGLRRAASCCGVVGAIRLGVGAAIATSCCGVCVPIASSLAPSNLDPAKHRKSTTESTKPSAQNRRPNPF